MHHSVRNLLSSCGVEMWPTAGGGEIAVRRADPDQEVLTFNPKLDVITVPYIEGLITCVADVLARSRQDGPDVIIYTEPGKTIRVLDTELTYLARNPELYFDIVKPRSDGDFVWVSL